MESENIMENKESTVNKSSNKAAETLAKELEGLSNEGLHEFFMFFYKLNHMHGNSRLSSKKRLLYRTGTCRK